MRDNDGQLGQKTHSSFTLLVVGSGVHPGNNSRKTRMIIQDGATPLRKGAHIPMKFMFKTLFAIFSVEICKDTGILVWIFFSQYAYKNT